jgi:uncharacterized protein GlcG (DUF336 family)
MLGFAPGSKASHLPQESVCYSNMNSDRLFLTVACAILVIAGSPLAASGQGLPTQKMLSIGVAQTIAQEAMSKCRADGYKVTVTVVDSSNILKAFLRDDGAVMGTIEIARMKANSVIAFGRPSGPPPNLAPGAPVPPPTIPGTSNAMGGVPIKVGDELIGAISVSGAPGGDKDAVCANFAVEKVMSQLK